VSRPAPRPPLSSPGNLRSLPVRFASDAAFVDALVAQHPSAVRVLWDRYAELVRRLLARSLGTDEMDDAAQDVFLRVLAKIDRLREPSKLRSFVVGVTMRVAREILRRRRVRRLLVLTPAYEVPEPAVPGADFESAEMQAHLDALLARIDGDAREVFVLRFVEEIPAADIADALGCSLATAKRRIKRARERVIAAAERDPVLRDLVGPEDSAAGGELVEDAEWIEGEGRES
jgi:RNA polymerase sigma-70 factor, ECF subfamily